MVVHDVPTIVRVHFLPGKRGANPCFVDGLKRPLLSFSHNRLTFPPARAYISDRQGIDVFAPNRHTAIFHEINLHDPWILSIKFGGGFGRNLGTQQGISFADILSFPPFHLLFMLQLGINGGRNHFPELTRCFIGTDQFFQNTQSVSFFAKNRRQSLTAGEVKYFPDAHQRCFHWSIVGFFPGFSSVFFLSLRSFFFYPNRLSELFNHILSVLSGIAAVLIKHLTLVFF